MEQAKVFFRADGNAKIGLGHVIRSLALAEMLEDDFECHFLIRSPLSSLKEQILETCSSLIELPDTVDDLAEAQFIVEQYLDGSEIVVLDGYHFVTDYQQTIKDSGCKLVCIDDIHAYHFVADVVINHAPGVKNEAYLVEAHTKLCLGLDYALLRKPFLNAAKAKRNIQKIENIFICFGGADLNNLSLKILKYITTSSLLIRQVNVVLGSANIHKSDIEDYIKNIPTPNIKLHGDLSASEMCDLMLQNELAIVPASSILYEIIAVKMPVISGYYVDNQINIYHGFRSLALIDGVADFNTFSGYDQKIATQLGKDIKKVIERQESCIDGSSKINFIQLFNQL